MEYIVLNEESIPFDSRNDSEMYLPVFFEILSDAFVNKMDSIRITENLDSGWYNILVADGLYLRDWIGTQNIDYKIKLKTIIAKTKLPQIPVHEIEISSKYLLSEFWLANDCTIQTKSLGVAFLLKQLAISFQSNEIWNSSELNLTYSRIDEDENITEEICNAKNVTQFVHWQHHLRNIIKERRDNFRKGRELWEHRETEFSNLIFCNSTKKQFQQLDINDATYVKLYDNLQLLNNNIEECSNDSDLKGTTNLNFSDESESVKDNPKLRRFREFTLPNHETKFFGLHVKNFPASMRLHFYPDYLTKKIYIGYFGKHLPSKRY